MDPLALLDVRTLHEERVAEAIRQERWRASVMSVSDQRGAPWPQFVAWLATLFIRPWSRAGLRARNSLGLTRCETFHTMLARVHDIVPRVLTVPFVPQNREPLHLMGWRRSGSARTLALPCPTIPTRRPGACPPAI